MTGPEQNPHNPYDKTIWDPTDPEHAIEDPFHGPDAVLGLLAIPPLKQPDGSYYVFGASYVCGTSTFDSEGKPFIEFKAGPTSSFMRDLEEHRKWVEAFNAGELPPREEMELPEFRYDEPPYIRIQAPAETEIPTLDVIVPEASRKAEKFDTELIGFTLTDDERARINDYIRELIDSYNGAETLAPIEGNDQAKPDATLIEGFETKHGVYIVKGSVAGWFDGEELEVCDVRYPSQEGQDNPELHLGPVDTKTGKLIITFQGLHFRTAHDQPEAENDDGFYKTYGFIYDPAEDAKEYACLVSDENDLATADRMVRVLSDNMLGRGKS